jgi:hypothetical protein
MKNLNVACAPLLIVPALLSGNYQFAKAQQLPNVQTVNVLAPMDVKTDGKASEWGGSFEAYNKNTTLFYTMANDNEKLYLTIQARDMATIATILSGGVRLLITSPDKGTKLLPLVINYPIIRAENAATVLTYLKTQTGEQNTLYAVNSQLEINARQIKITGVKEIADSLISVTNKHGVTAAGMFDQQHNYTCELSVTLKYLLPYINDIGTFSYSVSLKGVEKQGGGIANAPSFTAKYTLAR